MKSMIFVTFLVLSSLPSYAQSFKDERPRNKWDHKLCGTTQWNYIWDFTGGRYKNFKEALKKRANPNVLCPQDYGDPETPLYRAVSFLSFDYITDLINAGADVNRANSRDLTEVPIVNAAMYGKWDYVRYFLEKGAVVSGPIMTELVTGCSESSESHYVFKSILDKNPDLINSQAENGLPLVFNVCGLQTMKLLVSRGLNIHERDEKGNSVLPRIVRRETLPSSWSYSHKEKDVIALMEYLIESGLSVDEVSSTGFTLLQLAAYALNPNIVKLLIEKYHLDPNALNSKGLNALQMTAENELEYRIKRNSSWKERKYHFSQVAKNLSPVTHDLTFTLSNGETLLLYAIVSDDMDLAHFLLGLEKDLDINAVNHEGESALSLATKKNDFTLVKNLISQGARTSFIDSYGNDLLMIAAHNGNLQMVSLYLEKKLGVKRQNAMGQTALMLAIKAKAKTTVFYLLKENASVSVTDFNGKTALAYAVETGDQELINLIRMYQVSSMGN